jgi:hypothetical protein
MRRVDESYIREILKAMPTGLTRQQFRSRCKPDINGGYRAEVAEAEARYFKGRRGAIKPQDLPGR